MNDADNSIAELIAVVASGRADPLVDVALKDAPPQVWAALQMVRESIAALALAVPPVAPSAGLKARIFRTMAARAYAPKRALLVVDMLNDHLAPGGPHEVPRARDIVPALKARIDAARADGMPIIYVVDEHEPDDSDLEAWGAHNVRGTKGAMVWSALAPEAGDRVVKKRTYSAFSKSTLRDTLREVRADTLVLTGCLTEVGILTTATDALQQGFAVEVPADSQAGATETNEQIAMGVLRLLPPYGPAREALLRELHAA